MAYRIIKVKDANIEKAIQKVEEQVDKLCSVGWKPHGDTKVIEVKGTFSSDEYLILQALTTDYKQSCAFCGSTQYLLSYNNVLICPNCAKEIRKLI